MATEAEELLKKNKKAQFIEPVERVSWRKLGSNITDLFQHLRKHHLQIYTYTYTDLVPSSSKTKLNRKITQTSPQNKLRRKNLKSAIG